MFKSSQITEEEKMMAESKPNESTDIAANYSAVKKVGIRELPLR